MANNQILPMKAELNVELEEARSPYIWMAFRFVSRD